VRLGKTQINLDPERMRISMFHSGVKTINSWLQAFGVEQLRYNNHSLLFYGISKFCGYSYNDTSWADLNELEIVC
jgi:hypothetical protein